MNDPFIITEVKSFLVSHKVDVCALLETRIRCHNVGKVQKVLATLGLGSIIIITFGLGGNI